MTTFYKYIAWLAIQRNTKYNPCHTTDKKLKIIVERPITGDNVEKVIWYRLHMYTYVKNMYRYTLVTNPWYC